jgi:hypothetical protein
VRLPRVTERKLQPTVPWTGLACHGLGLGPRKVKGPRPGWKQQGKHNAIHESQRYVSPTACAGGRTTDSCIGHNRDQLGLGNPRFTYAASMQRMSNWSCEDIHRWLFNPHCVVAWPRPPLTAS